MNAFNAFIKVERNRMKLIELCTEERSFIHSRIEEKLFKVVYQHHCSHITQEKFPPALLGRRLMFLSTNQIF